MSVPAISDRVFANRFSSLFSSGFAITFAVLTVFFGLHDVHAQSSPFENMAEGLTLSPPMFDMTLLPGEETAHTIRITNPTKNLIELYPSAGNFTSSGDGGEPKYEIGEEALESDSRFSLADWVFFDTPKVALLPEQIVEFRFRIKVPENAEPGGHYGVVFLGTRPPEERSPEAQVALSSMVGSLLLVRIPGDVREGLEAQEFSTPWFFFAPPVDFTVFLRNTGNVHVRPMGEVSISDWRGHVRERIDINPTKGNILPESRRMFTISWKPETPYFWNIPAGRFQATLSGTYGQTSGAFSQTISFWIVPKWMIVTLSILFVIIFFLFLRMIFQRRKKGESHERYEKIAWRIKQIARPMRSDVTGKEKYQSEKFFENTTGTYFGEQRITKPTAHDQNTSLEYPDDVDKKRSTPPKKVMRF